jgi:hypothetical protein
VLFGPPAPLHHFLMLLFIQVIEWITLRKQFCVTAAAAA